MDANKKENTVENNANVGEGSGMGSGAVLVALVDAATQHYREARRLGDLAVAETRRGHEREMLAARYRGDARREGFYAGLVFTYGEMLGDRGGAR